MRAKLDAVERSRTEPIAVIGASVRLPGGVVDLASYWQLLHTGGDAITNVPLSRWDADAYYDPDPETPGKISSRRGGFIADVDLFDALFFGIAPREAAAVDPQQRLLLEVAWEALEDAGIAAESLIGSNTAVFVGISNDYNRLLFENLTRLTGHSGSGTSTSQAAGRPSYVLASTAQAWRSIPHVHPRSSPFMKRASSPIRPVQFWPGRRRQPAAPRRSEHCR